MAPSVYRVMVTSFLRKPALHNIIKAFHLKTANFRLEKLNENRKIPSDLQRFQGLAVEAE